MPGPAEAGEHLAPIQLALERLSRAEDGSIALHCSQLQAFGLSGDTATVSGTCTVNHEPGHGFRLELTDGSSGKGGSIEQLGCPCTLKLWEAGGPRTVTLGNVIFPVGQKAAP